MRCVRMALLAALPSIALITTSAQANSCWYPNEAKAAQLRDFHIMLMVGTLQCRTRNSAAVERYNEFVTRQRGLLDANAYVLKAHFMRENGIQDAQRAYDRYATSLANQRASRIEEPGFCQTVDTFVRMATDATQSDLLTLAASLSDAPVSGTCPPSNYIADATAPSVSKDTAAAPEDSAAATPGYAAAASGAGAKPEAASSAEPAAAAAESAGSEKSATTEPVAAAAPAPATPASATDSRDEALKAAIVALQSATAALQAATASTAPTETAAATKKDQPALVKVVEAPVVPPQEEAAKTDE